MNFDDRRRLSWIVLEVTDRCNFKCKWCYSNSWRNKNPKDLSYRRVSRVLGYLADEGVGQVTLSGGEPTMYPYLRQTIKEARDLGLVVHMNTNGFLFDEKMAEDLYSLGLSQIQVNIDSLDPDKHDRIRGMRGSWHRAVGALMNARDVGMTAACQTVLTSENEDEIL
ncbi:MAG: radical SAM/SPASM domain-containing protein, partial [Candidatus Altiarchaeales archaeon ex4484_96]